MLDVLLPATVFAYLLLFVRVGAALMLMPAIGEGYVNPTARLALALLVSLVMMPVVGEHLPEMPASTVAVALLILGEVLVGLFLGTIARMLISALSTAGMLIAQTTGMANALINDPTTAQQGAIAGNFLTVTALLLILMLELHHLFLYAVADSYLLFAPGQVPDIADMSNLLARLLADVFLLAFKLAAPFLVVATIFYIGLGLLARLMPQMQVFFIALPLLIAIGLFMLALLLPVIMRIYLGTFEDTLLPFVGT